MIKRKHNKVNINNIGLHKDCTDKIEKMHQMLVLKENEVVERITDNDELKKQYTELLNKQNLFENLLDEIGVKESYEDIYKFIEYLYFFKLNHKCNCSCNSINKEKKDKEVFLDINYKKDIFSTNTNELTSDEDITLNNNIPISEKVISYINIDNENKGFYVEEEKPDLEKNQKIENTILDIEVDENILVPDDKIFKKYPIHIFPKTNNKCYNYAAGELCNNIKYNHGLMNIIEKEDKTLFDDVCKYIEKADQDINVNKNYYNIKKKIERCKYLYDTYEDKLKYIKFNQKVFRLGKTNWKKWLSFLDKKIKLVTDDQNISSNSNIEEDDIQFNSENNKNINNFNYEFILMNKKAHLFEENNITYTYNLYEQKIIADVPDGILCNHCNYTRYNSSPCIYKDCKNRKYGDTEFDIYRRINGREMESKYNKKYLNNKLSITNESDDSDSENTDTDLDEEIEDDCIF